MHGVAMGHAIDYGLIVESDGLDDKGVAFPPAHGIPEVRGIRVFRKCATIHPDFTECVRIFEEHKDSLRSLHNLNGLLLGDEIGQADLTAADILVLAQRGSTARMAPRQILSE